MLKLSKKVDYALMALMHLAQQPGSSSTREIAVGYGMPQDLLAKILQKLTREGLVVSQQGTKGGYRLARAADAISVVHVIEIVEGPPSLTQCFTDVGACDQFDTCNIKSPLQRLNDHVLHTLSRVTIAAMCDEDFRFLTGIDAEAKRDVQLPVVQG
jgi:Rrf2 family protein